MIVAVAAVAGSAAPSADRTALLLPIGLAAGLGLTALAIVRYETFLAFLIAARASLDVVKVSESSVDATGAVSVLFIGATFLWLLRNEDAFTIPSPARAILAPLIVLLAAAAISVTASGHPLESGLEVVRMGTVVVIVLALARVIRTRQHVRRFLLAIACSTLLPLAAAGLQLLRGGGGRTVEGISRVDGTFRHPNPFAAYLFLMIVVGVSLLPHVGTRWRWALGALVACCGGVLITTYARGAWIATFIGLAIVGLLQSRRVLWLLGAAAIAAVLIVPSVGVRLSDLSEERAASGAPGNSLAWRFAYWREALALQEDPVFGIGLKEVQLSDESGAAPHNDLVRLYVETGLVGLGAYLWFFAALLREALRGLRRAPPGIARGLNVAFLAALTGIVVLSLAANVISQLVILWYFAAIVVLAMAAGRLETASPAAAR